MSTGPKTDRGKAASSGNSTTHGLSGAGLVLPEAMAGEVNARFTEFCCVLRPFDSYDTWLCEVATVSSVVVDTAERHLVALRHEQARRAKTSWHDDRRAEAGVLAERLARHPEATVRGLRATLHGAEWLIERWEGLA